MHLTNRPHNRWITTSQKVPSTARVAADAVILQQPVTGIGVNTLATMLRTSREMLICRAGQLGVSLDISDEVAETRAFSCSDKRLVDPLLERLKQIHGDRT